MVIIVGYLTSKEIVLLPGYRWLEEVPARRGGRLTVKGENYKIPVDAVYEVSRLALETLRKVEAVTVEAIG